ncbi:alpha/beta-hydrolase [Panaeolus papilionaceus]|nr:alpha/beta-hydrolase [Panaeolus papilionaceus]
MSANTFRINKTLYTLPPSSNYPFYVLVTHYETEQSASNTNGLTLVCMHALGMHKESWEVPIQSLLGVKQKAIRDIFSIEMPNHGESSILNEAVIQQNPDETIAQAIYNFITANSSDTVPPKPDLSKRRFVGVGHSLGAVALFLMRDIKPVLPFESIIAIEPGISIEHTPERDACARILTAWTWLRHDVWMSRKAAKKELKTSPVHSTWDPRILDLYVKHALKTHPAAALPEPYSFHGVTTCLSKAQEAACIRSRHAIVDALDSYTRTTQEIPVHIVFGAIHDVANPVLQAIITDEKNGRKPRTVTHVEGAGHLTVQQAPEKIASLIHSLLAEIHTSPRMGARL